MVLPEDEGPERPIIIVLVLVLPWDRVVEVSSWCAITPAWIFGLW